MIHFVIQSVGAFHDSGVYTILIIVSSVLFAIFAVKSGIDKVKTILNSHLE